MRIARSSSRRGEGGLPQCMLGYTPPGVGLENPPPRHGPGDLPGCGPGDTPSPGVGLESPRPDPSTSPLGGGLQTGNNKQFPTDLNSEKK